MANSGRTLRIIPPQRSLKQLGLFTLSILSKLLRKSTRSFASSRVCPEPAKHSLGSTLPPDAETWANRHTPSFSLETARLSLCSVKHLHVTRLHDKRALVFECERGKLLRASKLSSKTFIIFATMH